jgi:hypothetical protein
MLLKRNSLHCCLAVLLLVDIGIGNAVGAAECKEGSVSVFAAGADAAAFGATEGANDVDGDSAAAADVCTKFCLPEMALSFVPGVTAGFCVQQGCTAVILEGLEAELAGSPAPLSVTICARDEQPQQAAAACDEGSASAFAGGAAAAAFGATATSDTCAEFCLPEMALSFVAGAIAGTRASQGHTALVESALTVELEGSPMALVVSIHSSGSASSSTHPEDSTSGGMWHDPDPSAFDGPCIDCPGHVALSGADKLDRVWGAIAACECPQLPENWLHKRTDPTAMEMINDFPDKTRVNSAHATQRLFCCVWFGFVVPRQKVVMQPDLCLLSMCPCLTSFYFCFTQNSGVRPRLGRTATQLSPIFP